MHNNTLLVSLGVFFLAMLILIIALVWSIHETQETNPILIEDQPLKVLNRIDGIDGPALYEDERLKTSLFNCNKTNKDISVLSQGVFRKSSENLIIVIDPASIIRHPGCETTIRMSSGTAKERGLTPGTWTIEGTRSVRENTETLQTITFTSESFKVVAR